MKIIYTLASPEYTGPAEPILYLAQRFRSEKNEVSFFNNTKDDGNLFEMIQKLGLAQNPHIILSRHSLGLEITQDVYHLRKLFKKYHPDIIHCHFTHDHNLVTLACLGLSPQPIIVRTLHTFSSVQKKLSRTWIFQNTKGFIFPCKEYQKIFAENYPQISLKMTAIISGGVDTDTFSPEQASSIRREFDVGENDHVLGIVSRIKPDRLHKNLMYAFQKLSLTKKLYLFVVGRGESKTEIENMVKELGLSSKIKFLGYRSDDLAKVFASFDAHILLAEGNDGTCRAFLQAMASGNALLSPKTGALGEANIEGVTGYHFNSNDIDSIVSAIQKIFSGGLLNECKQNARNRAVAHYYQDRPFIETKTFYQNIITDQNQ